MYSESSLDRITTGRNPHWTESPLLVVYLKCTNMYFNLALQQHYEDKLRCIFLFVASYQDLETEEMRGYSCQGLGNPGMLLKADYL